MKKTSLLVVALSLALVGFASAQSLDKAELWSTYNDVANGGDSTMEVTAATESIDGADKFVISAKGVITDKFQYGFAGVVATPDEAALAALKAGKSISFKAIGDGKSYRIRLETNDRPDFNYNGKVFFTKKGKVQAYSFKYSDFAQEAWGAKVKFNPDNIVKLSFQTQGQPYPSVELKIFDLQINQ
jgi:hypothetical protein